MIVIAGLLCVPTVSLWDGGAYENLGLEPLYKMDRGMIDCDYIVVSDASGAVEIGRRNRICDLLGGNLASPRLFDIASDQIRSRSRRAISAAVEPAISSRSKRSARSRM
jgi:NTE family protein